MSDLDHRCCRYCWSEDVSFDPIEEFHTCNNCGAQWTTEGSWQHLCCRCGLYIDFHSKCKPGCSQNSDTAAWLT